MNKYLLATVIITASLVGSATYAYKGNPSVVGPNYNPTKHTAIQQAFQTSNYDLWKTNVNPNSKPAKTITSETFSKFVQMRNLLLQGKTDEANKIKVELGLGKQGNSCSNGQTNCQGQNKTGKACSCGQQKGNCQKTGGCGCTNKPA